MKLKFLENAEAVKNNVYDNKGAHDTIKHLMENNSILRLKFCTDREGYLATMVETAKTSGFKYRLNENSLNWLWEYITKGSVEDFGIDPMNVVPDEESKNFQETLLRQLVLKKENGDFYGELQVTPMFREISGKVTATASLKKGKITFSMERTTELVDFLKEHQYIA